MSTALVKNFTVAYMQEEEFADLKKEIFGAQIYYFATQQSQPIIIDAGAHLGLASLYFKWLYPRAAIIAFEPNPQLAKLYRLNMMENNLSSVTLHEAALGKTAGQKSFWIDDTSWQWQSVGSFYQGAWNGEQKKQREISVQVVRLNDYLGSLPRVDLLKLDIEGAEAGVLLSLKKEFFKVKNLIFEWHDVCGSGVKLGQIMAYLTKQGFTLVMKNRANQLLHSYHRQELILLEGRRDD